MFIAALAHTHVCTHTHAHTHTHTHACTHKHRCTQHTHTHTHTPSMTHIGILILRVSPPHNFLYCFNIYKIYLSDKRMWNTSHTSLIRSAGEISGACNAHNKIAPELISGLCGRPNNSIIITKNCKHKMLTFTI